ncbi:LysR substrate-binding domain-containing protein [uncultured Paracoccus sp.]|jgi:LysR family glycine cleavage system transcriptional activator|uniref:LysR substrate-binding domain-containing protein n=1 Tax=uncultured Paracoccus sp. TaxID=189685 RepID=UPI00261F281C|nr:LysR substrate-binding domain-containing protein [uncultured Paracoccus sp.]
MKRRQLPSLNALRAFEAYARSGSMVLASEELCVTHGAISRQIKALECALGTELLTGPRHALRLTKAGRNLADALRDGFDRIAAGLPRSDEDEELVISVPATFAMKWLIPRLAGFTEQHPDIRVHIAETSSSDSLFGGEDGALAAIRLCEGPPPAGVTATAFLDHAYGPVIAPALFEADGRTPERMLRRARLSSETFPHGWDQWAAETGVTLSEPSQTRSFEHNTYLLEAVAGGLGIAVTAWAFAQADIDAGRLVAPWGFRQLPARFNFLRPSRAGHPGAVRVASWLLREGRRTDPPPVALIESM